MPATTDVGRLIVSCPDRPGIIAAVSTALAATGANIVASDQHSTDPEGGDFFLRMEFHLGGFARRRAEIEQRIGELAGQLELDWRLTAAEERKRVALFASRPEHCFMNLCPFVSIRG